MMNPLHYRIFDISYRNKLSHLGSCLGAAEIFEEIYAQRLDDEPVICSPGHAALGLYVVLEKYCNKDAEDLLKRHGAHPSKNLSDGIYCSTGSLGQGLTVAVGRALANRKRRVWCLISDGEMAEGVVYEALNYAKRINLTNLQVYGFFNGYGAYHDIDPLEVTARLTFMLPWAKPRIRTVESLGLSFLVGQNAHYKILKPEDWEWVETLNRRTQRIENDSRERPAYYNA